MKVKVTYYRLGPNGMPTSPEQHEVVEVHPGPSDDKETLIHKALSEQTYITEDKFKVIETNEM
ncbi:hypothetical protein [Domibacillus robiginosus]|uniref:hypothetical protein n=1 Tax=Domibacillus robiginosus TaxID=1071054 RepID=UPI00067B24E6|nr:hypothetical protein [Domibacillus robiginosus]